MTEGGELVERLKPRHVKDLPVAAVIDILRGQGFARAAERLTDWIVEDNGLKSEAATALAERDKRIAELERELFEARKMQRWDAAYGRS